MQNESNLKDVAMDQSEGEPKNIYIKQLNQYMTDEYAVKRAYKILKNTELTAEEREEIHMFIMDRKGPKCIMCDTKIQNSDVMRINGEAYCPECFGKFWERIRRK